MVLDESNTELIELSMPVLDPSLATLVYKPFIPTNSPKLDFCREVDDRLSLDI